MRIVWITDLHGRSGATTVSKLFAKGFSRIKSVEFILCGARPVTLPVKEPYVEGKVEGTRCIIPTRTIYDAIDAVKPDVVVCNVFGNFMFREFQRIKRDYYFVSRIEINPMELMIVSEYAKFLPQLCHFIQESDYLVVCSENSKRVVESLGGEDVTIIPNPVDLDRFQPSKPAGNIIGIAGRIGPIKNHLTLMEAFKKVVETVPDAELLVLGSGALQRVYQQLASEMGLGDKVKFAGYVINIERAYQDMKVFCLPSLSENHPTTVLEAMASGVPCILSNSGWAETFKSPLKAIHDNPDDWYKKIVKLLTDEHKWKKVRYKQLLEVEKYALDKITKKMYSYLQQVVSKPRFTLRQEQKYPRVSVIVPVKNRVKTIKRCLNSILSEGYPNLEVIVVDGGSTDGTLEVLKEYSKKYGIKYISEPDKNQSEAKNKGLRIATGEYVTFLDSDDVQIKGKLSVLSDYLNKHPECFAVFGKTVIRNPNGREVIAAVPSEISYETLLKANYIGSCSIMLRNSPVVRFDENIRYGEDWVLWLKLIKKYRIDHIDVPVYKWSNPIYRKDTISGELFHKKAMPKGDKITRQVERIFKGTGYNKKMRITILTHSVGIAAHGGPSFRAYNILRMLMESNLEFDMYVIEKLVSPYKEIVSEHVKPIGDFKPDKYNIFYWTCGNPSLLAQWNIRPILGANIIPNSAPKFTYSQFKGDQAWLNQQQQLEIYDRQMAQSKGVFWLAQSEFQKSEYRRLGVEGPVYIAPNPLDTRLFMRRENYGSYIAWDGNRGWAKGFDRILVPIMKAYPQEQFLCFTYHRLPTMQNMKQLYNCTLWDIAHYLQKAKVFISTSYTENQPLGVLQAMACELPVIAFRVGGIPEIIQDGETGLLVEPYDLTEYKEKLDWLLADEGLRRRLGKNARQYVLENFNYEVLLDRYVEIFDRYLVEVRK